ncbi:MAG: hypothetical protein ING59_11610 [Burkholderiales bacterium]|jgi:hypothetical protein|nr:hypothetical protein [Burkholderiales bacterium]
MLNKLPGFRRARAGLEWTVLRHLPRVAVIGTALPLAVSLLASLIGGDAKQVTMIHIAVISVLVLHWTAVGTVALLCAIVWIAKGPAYVADAYHLPDADRPR